MAPARPAITVVVPCRNEADNLRACLDALAAQDFPAQSYEVLVVDGHSVDGCPEIALRRGFRLLQDPGRGPAAARNVGIVAARGDVIAFTDADCIPRSDWLTRIAQVLAEEPTLSGVAGSLRLPRTTLLGRLEDNDALLHYRGFITSNVAYRRKVLRAVGGFDETLDCAEDYDLAWRLLDAGHRIAHDPRPQVIHNAPELRDGLWTYLGKQRWYGEHDVLAHAIAMRRATAYRDGLGPGSAHAIWGSVRGLANAVPAAAVIGGLTTSSTRLTTWALVGTVAASGQKVASAARKLDDVDLALPAMVTIHTAKCLARGIGTLQGLARLSRPERWRALKLSGVVELAPAPPPTVAAPRARA